MEQGGFEQQGIVSRVTDFGLAFVRDAQGRNFSFRFNQIRGYRGEYPKEIGLKSGRRVRFSATEDRIDEVVLEASH